MTLNEPMPPCKKASLKSRPKSSGLIDSIRFIINNYYQNNMEILKI